MASSEYYKQGSATGDLRTGRGYGKAQKTPSFGTGVGSERSMGSSDTGIYPEPPPEYEEDEEDLYSFDIDKFVKRINKGVTRSDPTFWPRADRSSLGQSAVSSAPAMLALTEKSLPVAKGQKLPGVMNTIAPFPHAVLYPNGFSGPALGSGGSGQAFRTTGNYKRTGTQYGTSRASKNQEYNGDEDIMTFQDILDMDPSERSIHREKIKIMKILNKLDEIDVYND